MTRRRKNRPPRVRWMRSVGASRREATPSPGADRAAPWSHPPRDALVVRGGVLDEGDLKKAAERCEAVRGHPGISIYADRAKRHELLAASRLPHAMLSFTTAGRLYDAGFKIEQTQRFPHHTVSLPEDWRETDTLRRFRDAFDPPIRRSSVDLMPE